MDYQKKLNELVNALHLVEIIIKEMNEEKQAIAHVNVTVPFTSIVNPERRTHTESEIVCYHLFPSTCAFDLRELMETEFDESTGCAYTDINGVEVNQWVGKDD